MHRFAGRSRSPWFLLKNGALVLENSPVKPPERSEGLLEVIATWPIEHSRGLRTILSRVGEEKRQSGGSWNGRTQRMKRSWARCTDWARAGVQRWARNHRRAVFPSC